MARKKVFSELQQAEVRHRSLLEKRDQYNADARAVRKERDLLNEKKGALRKEANALRDRRSRLIGEVREHKARRNDLQKKAKEMIQVRRQLRGKLKGGVAAEVQRLRKRIAEMETQQQTLSLELDAEARLLDNLRRTREDLTEVERVQAKHEAVLKEAGELEGAIDDRFRRADAHHEQVVMKSEKVQAARAELDEKLEELARLTAEANRIHDLFLKVKGRADYYHQRAVEMRKEVIARRRSRRKEAAEGRKLAAQQKESVKEALDDEERLDQAVDEALASLRRGEKLEL